MKILLAEDDKFISRAYQDGFTRAGFDVVLAFDGNEALAKAVSEKPDLILLDLVMPNKNGFEALGELKTNKFLKKTPVIVLSNLGQDSDIERAKELGATDYMIKADFSMQEVVGKIKEYVVSKSIKK